MCWRPSRREPARFISCPSGCQILVFGPLAGAHFNPAVSLAFALRGALPWSISGLYIVAQVLGSIVGVWVAHMMFELPVWQLSMTARSGSGQWLAEAVATFGLPYSAVSRKSPKRPLTRLVSTLGGVLVHLVHVIRKPRRYYCAVTF